jgi:hypothetical protein
LYGWKGLALSNVWPYREDPTNQVGALGGYSSKWIDDVFIEIRRRLDPGPFDLVVGLDTEVDITNISCAQMHINIHFLNRKWCV